jgi:type IX secretion system PorP/SprF family membrane protein
MKYIHALMAFGAILLLTRDVQAQDPEFSQFYATPIYTNPAMAGTGQCDGGGRAVINYRNQWPSLPGTFVTTAFSYDQHFDRIGGGFGILAMRDQAGEGLLTSNNIAAVYSYQLRVTRKFTMRFGLQGEFGQRSIDWQKLRFEDQIDPSQGFVNPTQEPYIGDAVNYVDFATGILGYTENFYFGAAVHNLIEPNQSFYDDPEAVLPRRYTVHSGVVIPLDRRRNPKSTISPNALFMLQEKFTQLNFGFYVNRGPLVTGLWFRQTFGEFKNPDALILLAGFRKDKFKFGYSLDLTVSDARSAAPMSHEISAAIEWCASKRPIRYRPLSCPDF